MLLDEQLDEPGVDLESLPRKGFALPCRGEQRQEKGGPGEFGEFRGGRELVEERLDAGAPRRPAGRPASGCVTGMRRSAAMVRRWSSVSGVISACAHRSRQLSRSTAYGRVERIADALVRPRKASNIPRACSAAPTSLHSSTPSTSSSKRSSSQCTLDQRPQVCGALRLQPGFGGRDERVLRRSFQVAAQEPKRQPDRQVGGMFPLQRDRLRLGREQVRSHEPQKAGLSRSRTADEQVYLPPASHSSAAMAPAVAGVDRVVLLSN